LILHCQEVASAPMVLACGVDDGGGDGTLLPWSMNSRRVHRHGGRHMGSRHRNHGERHCLELHLVEQQVDSDDGRQSSDSVDKLCDTIHHNLDNMEPVSLLRIFPDDFGKGTKALKATKLVLEREKWMLWSASPR